MLYGCGIRVAELVDINLDDFQGEDVLLVRGKGKKERQVIVGECARAALKAWLPQFAMICCGIAPTRLRFSSASVRADQDASTIASTTRSIRRIIKTVAKARGLDPQKLHPHLLRHACATHLLDHGASLQSVSKILGHERLSTTQIYTRVSVGRMMKTYRAAHPHARQSINLG